MELADDVALERVAAGVKFAADGLNLNSLALGLSLKAGAVEGRPSGRDPCQESIITKCLPEVCLPSVQDWLYPAQGRYLPDLLYVQITCQLTAGSLNFCLSRITTDVA